MNRKNLVTGTLLTLLLLAAWTTAAHAESYFGFQGGVNFATLGGDIDAYGDQVALDLEDEIGGVWTASTKGRRAFAGGLTYALMYKPAIGIQVEAMYASRGARIDFARGGVQAKADYKFDYLEIPLMLRYAPTHGHSKQVLFMFGPVLGFKMDSKVSVSGHGVSAPDLESSIDVATSTIFGLTGVVAFRASLSDKTALLLQTRYYNAVTNAIDHTDFTTTSKDFTLLAGLEFALGE